MMLRLAPSQIAGCRFQGGRYPFWRQPWGLGLGLAGLGLALMAQPSLSQHQSSGLVLTGSEPVLAQGLGEASAPLARLMEQTTVRVYAGSTAGSGVIVGRSGSTYQVLTNRHVVEWDDQVHILTIDRQSHPSATVQPFAGLDLALVTFHSDRAYPIAPLSPTLPPVGTPVYAAGFPLYQTGLATDTTAQGRQAFYTTQGHLSQVLPYPLPEGYGLGSSNPIEIGMSGGPLFNQQGQVVGINGRSGGRDAGFGGGVLANGQVLRPELADQLASLSWAIPVVGGLPGLAISPAEKVQPMTEPPQPLPQPLNLPSPIEPAPILWSPGLPSQPDSPQFPAQPSFTPDLGSVPAPTLVPHPTIDPQSCDPTTATCAIWSPSDSLPSSAPPDALDPALDSLAE